MKGREESVWHKEKEGFVWNGGRLYSAEEWKLRTETWKALQEADTVEEREAILKKARKKLRSLPKLTGYPCD